MIGPFTLVIPTDARFRTIGADVAGRFAEIAGGRAAAVAAEVSRAVETIAARPDAAPEVHLTFRAEANRVDVDLRCGARTASISCPL